MIKKSVDDAVLDTILAKAFEEAAERDLAEMPADPEAARRYPEAYKKIERKRYERAKRGGVASTSGKRFVPVLQRVVSVVLIIGFLGCCVMLATPKIRAEFMGMVTKFLEECFSITLPSNVTSYETDGFIFGYVPDSYTVTENIKNPFVFIYSFDSTENESGFDIGIYLGENSISKNDIDYSEAIMIKINDHIGYMIDSGNDHRIRIVWTDNINLYYVYGDLSDTELIKIAENISVK